MFVLTKFFEKKEYQEDFVKGNFYLSSLSAYTKTYSERALRSAVSKGDQLAEDLLKKQQNISQRDIFEGTMASVSPDLIPELPEDYRSVMCTDIMIQALGYNYCKLMCFCKMEYHLHPANDTLEVRWNEPDMKDFGEYAVIIKDSEELVRRIDAAMSRQGYRYICGDVRYHPVTFRDENAERKHSITFVAQSPIAIDDILRRGKRHDYDVFDKSEVYKDQQEWRIAVNNGIADEQPLRINVGDLSDIVVKVRRGELTDRMNRLLTKWKIHPMIEEYVGNISRIEMRDEFYHMGEDKGNLLMTIG